MAVLGHHILLAIAIAALAAAGLRAASALGARGLERLVAMTVLAAGAAVLEALLLGLVGLGGDPLALTIAAAATWLVARLLPGGKASSLSELESWWRQASQPMRAVLGAALGALVAWVLWNLYRPDIGIDGLYYHLPEAVRWAQEGSPGSVEQIHPWFEVGSYPLAHEVLVSWGFGISQSMVWQAVATLALVPAGVAAAVLGLRRLGVAPGLVALAILSLFTVPVLAYQVDGAATDVPALVWLLCASGLAVAARDRTELLVPALMAAGLSIGSKTTALPLVAVLVLVVVIRDRHKFRAHAGLLVSALAAAAAVGLTWYMRDLIDHGSPFWPFAAAPWGDPQPAPFETFTSLRADPGAALEGNIGGYRQFLAGGWLVLAGAILSPLWCRTAPVVAGALCTLGGIVLWSSAPTSGASTFEQLSAPVSQTRYLLPTIALAAATLAISARGGRGARAAASALLGTAVAWSAIELVVADVPAAFSDAWILAGVIGGGALALGLGRLFRGAWPLPHARAPVFALAAVAGGVVAMALALSAPGYVSRYAFQDLYFDAGVVRFFEEDPRSADERPVRMAPEVFGALAGDELTREVDLIALDAPCSAVERFHREGWVIFRDEPIFERLLGYTSNRCLRGERPVAEIDGFSIYAPSPS